MLVMTQNMKFMFANLDSVVFGTTNAAEFTVVDRFYGQQSFITASFLNPIDMKEVPYISSMTEFRKSYC